MKMAKWTEDITNKFVEEYIKYECLYNPKDSKHFNKGAREVALLKISETMDIPGFGSKEVYTKIRNLKSTYSQESKKVKNSLRSGAGTDDIYVPRLKWFKLLDDALNSKNVQCRDSQSNTEPASEPNILEEEPSTSQHKQHAEKHNADPTPGSPIPRKRSLRDLSRLVSKVQTVADTIKAPTTSTETEFDIFGKMVTMQLNKLPLRTALEAQMFIQTYLGNLRLKEIGRESYDNDLLNDNEFFPYHDAHSNQNMSSLGNTSRLSPNQPTQTLVFVKDEENQNNTMEFCLLPDEGKD